LQQLQQVYKQALACMLLLLASLSTVEVQLNIIMEEHDY
jgi:hypothetical protein